MTAINIIPSQQLFVEALQEGLAETKAWLTSPRGKAMLVGLVYLSATLMLFATVALVGDLIDETNPQKTGINVLAHDSEFKWLIFTTLYGAGATAGLVAMLHELLRPTNARLSRVATSFGLMAAVMDALLVVFLFGVRTVLTNHRYKLAFVSYEYNALGDVGMTLFAGGLVVSIFFLGIYGAFVGYLTYHARYLPRALGAIVSIAGLAWVIALVPALTNDTLLAVLMLIGFAGPLAMSGWLVFKGITLDRWKAATVPEVPASNITGRPRLVH